MSDVQWTYIYGQRHQFFGEVKHRLTPNGDREVELVVMPDEALGFELGMAALAIDGSRSMLQPFAAHLPKMARKNRNTVHPIAQDLALHLAKNSHGQCAVAYWACSDDGGAFEPVGMMSTEDLNAYRFEGPENWGGGTKLTPIVRYFWNDVFVSSNKEGVAVIVTDGAWDDDDHRDLLQLTQEICNEIASGSRPLMKTVILGLKTDSNANETDAIEERFNSLDDFDSGTDIDVWDHKWLHEMNDYNEIFIEMVKDWPLGLGGRVDAGGAQLLARDEFNFGIQFQMPANVPEFVLHLEGAGDFAQRIV